MPRKLFRSAPIFTSFFFFFTFSFPAALTVPLYNASMRAPVLCNLTCSSFKWAGFPACVRDNMLPGPLPPVVTQLSGLKACFFKNVQNCSEHRQGIPNLLRKACRVLSHTCSAQDSSAVFPLSDKNSKTKHSNKVRQTPPWSMHWPNFHCGSICGSFPRKSLFHGK